MAEVTPQIAETAAQNVEKLAGSLEVQLPKVSRKLWNATLPDSFSAVLHV